MTSLRDSTASGTEWTPMCRRRSTRVRPATQAYQFCLQLGWVGGDGTGVIRDVGFKVETSGALEGSVSSAVLNKGILSYL